MLSVYSQEMLDHIVFATPDIAMSSEWIADLTGVTQNKATQVCRDHSELMS